MNLQEILDEIEDTCQTCEKCDPSCVGNTLKECIQTEVESEALLNLL